MNTKKLKRLAGLAKGRGWSAFINEKINLFSIHTPDDARRGNVIDWMGFDGVDCSKRQKAHNARFIAAFNPAIAIEMIDTLESAERERDEAIRQRDESGVRFHKAVQYGAEIERERDELRAELKRRDAAAGEAVGLVELSDYMTVEELAGMKPRRVAVKELFEGALKVGDHIYTAAQPPVLPPVANEREAFNAWNNDDNLPIAGVPAKNAAWLAWQARASLGAQPAASVPCDLATAVNLLLDSDGSRGTFSAIRRGDALAEVERLLAAAPAPGGVDA